MHKVLQMHEAQKSKGRERLRGSKEGSFSKPFMQMRLF